eukprot:318609_1
MRTAHLLRRIQCNKKGITRPLRIVGARQFHHVWGPRRHLMHASRLQSLFEEPLIPLSCPLGDIEPQSDECFVRFSRESRRFLYNSTDIVNNDKDYAIQMDLPGIKKNDIQISMKDGVLKIDGERKYEKTETNNEGKNDSKCVDELTFRKQNRFYGKFSQSVVLPKQNVLDDPTKITAKYEDGVLNICVPKKQTNNATQHNIKIL